MKFECWIEGHCFNSNTYELMYSVSLYRRSPLHPQYIADLFLTHFGFIAFKNMDYHFEIEKSTFVYDRWLLCLPRQNRTQHTIG